MNEQIQFLTESILQCQQEIQSLREQNEQQASEIATMNQTFHVFSEAINNLINIINNNKTSTEQNEALIQNIITVYQRLEQSINNVKYEILDPKLDKSRYFYPHIIDGSKAIEKIIHERKSIARFGDGEFAIMMNVNRQKFQKNDDRLSKRLIEVLNSELSDLLIGIADNYGSLEKYNTGSAIGIRLYITQEVRDAHQKLLNPNRQYYDAYLSRPYVLYKDNNTSAPKERFQHLQQIWENRDVIFVEGALTRLGVGNDLFANARSIKRIIAPATNSFDKYDEILSAALQYGTKDSLFLLALGPSACVLAYDLCINGFQAVDIGHVDLEYEWFLQGIGTRTAVPHKYNNEFQGGNVVEDIDDPVYQSQIICTFA